MGEVYRDLNAMRGYAAISVVLFHAGQMAGELRIVPGAYLAVDLFFCISGFVISHAYDGRMAVLGPWRFLLARLIRLYPLFLIGISIGLVRVAEMALAGRNIDGWGIAAVANILWLPAPSFPWTASFLSPIDVPGWSLLFEVWTSVAFAFLFPWLRAGVLLLIVCASAFALAVVAVAFGHTLELGSNWPSIAVGAARAGFSFPLGVLLHRNRSLLPRVGALPGAAPIAFVAIVMLPPSAISDLLFVVVVSPAIVIMASQSSVLPMATWGTVTSYAIYALHYPLMKLVGEVSALCGVQPALPIALAAAALVLTAPLIDRKLDRPARQWLGDVAARLGPYRR